MRWTTFTLALLVTAQMGWCFPGPEIPRPKQDVAHAVELATKAFLGERSLSEDVLKRRREYFVISMSYDTPASRVMNVIDARTLERESDKEWSWFVVLIHPKANDHTYTFRVMSDDSVRLYSRSI